jgi:hypothetical protein
MKIKAHFDGKVLAPDEPANLPVNCPLEVEVTPVVRRSVNGKPLSKLVEVARKFPATNGHSDAAAQHDHYLYGLRKRP